MVGEPPSPVKRAFDDRHKQRGHIPGLLEPVAGVPWKSAGRPGKSMGRPRNSPVAPGDVPGARWLIRGAQRIVPRRQ